MPAPIVATLGGATMGTTWCVRLVAPPHADLHALHAAIQAELDGVVREMSHWDADSALSRYNRAEAGTWHALPPGFATVLEAALDIARASDGAFDPTLGRLAALWGFGPHAWDRACTPSPQALAQVRAQSGWQRLQRRDADRTWLQPGGLQLDLSAIAKGYAIDCVQQRLRLQGIESALVEVGGELSGVGRKPDGSPWNVLLEGGPEEEDHRNPARIVQLDGMAVATSGDRWHHYTRGDHRYTHTLDPRSGEPVPHAPMAVSVLAASAMHADAWATALSVLDADTGLTLAARHGLGVRYLKRAANGRLRETMNPAFRRWLMA